MLQLIAEHFSMFMALLSLAGGGVAWYATRVKQNYGTERDINHLKRDYQQLSANMANITKEYDVRIDQLEVESATLRVRVDTLIRIAGESLTKITRGSD